LYDLAFLLMDLWHRDLRSHANAVLNRYFVKGADIGGLPLLPLFLSCRAAIRAKTSATAAALGTSSRGADELRLATTEYLRLAEVLLHPAKPRLVAIGGFSGSGKSVLARRLASGIGAVPGALIVQSDAIRKELFGADALTRLPMDAYAPEVTAIVYTTLVERSKAILAAGHSVIADATYADPVQRETIAAAARDAGVAFSGLWLDAPAAVLSNRVAARAAAATDVSDATAAVLQRQLATGAGPLSNWHLMDGSSDIDILVADAEQLVRILI
jgi:predicted kinase